MDEFPHTPIPRHGLAREEVLAQLLAMKQDDQDWRGGRVFSLVYSAGDEVHELLQDALSLYSAENGLNVLAFPSIGIMQHDIVQNTATLLGADDPASGGAVEGYLTSGGTESLLQAVKTARDVARHERGIPHPRIVAAESAHAAFTKAADYFDVELIRVPVGPDFRVDIDAFDAACTDATIMVIGSAPTYPHGVVDPIADIAALAQERGILCHVDACMGGFLLPFLTELGRFSEPFDFRLPGVTSMSADVHKYGYASKGVSVVLYRTHELARHQIFATSDWLGGFYASTAMAGTRPGRSDSGGLGRTDAHRARRLPGAHPHRTRCRAGTPGRHRVHRPPRSARRPAGHRHGVRRARPVVGHFRRRREARGGRLVPRPAEPAGFAPCHGACGQCRERALPGPRSAARRHVGGRDPGRRPVDHLRAEQLTIRVRVPAVPLSR